MFCRICMVWTRQSPESKVILAFCLSTIISWLLQCSSRLFQLFRMESLALKVSHSASRKLDATESVPVCWCPRSILSHGRRDYDTQRGRGQGEYWTVVHWSRSMKWGEWANDSVFLSRSFSVADELVLQNYLTDWEDIDPRCIRNLVQWVLDGCEMIHPPSYRPE